MTRDSQSVGVGSVDPGKETELAGSAGAAAVGAEKAHRKQAQLVAKRPALVFARACAPDKQLCPQVPLSALSYAHVAANNTENGTCISQHARPPVRDRWQAGA